MGPALTGLLVDTTPEGLGPVDFRSLSVREFGTIYEGLLESGLGIADRDLSVDKADSYVPAGPGSPVRVMAGEPYFHSRSGSRKATGSYFTKPFAVEHLLTTALEPAIDRHLARVSAQLATGATKAAAPALFDFRVADLSMGSAHFLVAAIDRIEARFSAFLIDHPLPETAVELHALRSAAARQLGIDPAESGIDDGVLLRRQIARRCIYGADINEIAVELGRLAIWIHTFVPGLPLSFLNHGLVWGNSLTGVGTLAELGDALRQAEVRELKLKNASQASSLDDALAAFLDRAAVHMLALGELSDASIGDVAAAGRIQQRLEAALEPLSALSDLITAERTTRHLGDVVRTKPAFDSDGHPVEVKTKIPHPERVMLTANPGLFTAGDAESLEVALLAHPDLTGARKKAAVLQAAHMPVRFPEVFRRDRPGFDCILGNPPWDKVRHEPQQFWVTRDPGLNALPPDAREARIEELRDLKSADAQIEDAEREAREGMQAIAKAGYDLLGGGHYDFAKMFAERFGRLTREDGCLGVVMPQAFLLLDGWKDLRRTLVDRADIVAAECRNTGGWLFDQVEGRTAVVLFSRVPATELGVRILPGLTSARAFSARWDAPVVLGQDDIDGLTETRVLPWFNGDGDRPLFDKMRLQPSLSSGDGWITGVSDSSRWDFSGSGKHSSLGSARPEPGCWRVLKTRHVDQYEITDDTFARFVNNPTGLASLNRGVEVVAGITRLASSHPAITYRFPSRNDDSRTLIATALPADGFLYATGYAHGIATGDADTPQILGLLGYINSVVADWWARRFVDRHVGSRIINNLPLPAWDDRQVKVAAATVSSLLGLSGQRTLPGGRPLPPARSDSLTRTQLRAELDALAALGFALTADDVEQLLTDFKPSKDSISHEYREAIRSAMTRTTGASA